MQGGNFVHFMLDVNEETSTLLCFNIINLDEEIQSELRDSIKKKGKQYMKKFEHFKSNLKVLVTAENEDLSNEFIVGGIIDKFFVQFELGWKVLKELLSYEGQSISATGSPKMILKTAYTIFDFIDEDIWLGMLKSRNDLTHIYDESSARRLVGVILKDYIPAFVKMQKGIEEYYGIELENI